MMRFLDSSYVILSQIFNLVNVQYAQIHYFTVRNSILDSARARKNDKNRSFTGQNSPFLHSATKPRAFLCFLPER